MTLKVTPASEASATDVKELIKAMRKTALFQHASEAALFRLAMEMERIQFGPGDVLGPDEGEPQSHLFVVTTGRLARRAQGRLVYEGVEETSPDLTEEIVLAETGAVRRYSTTELVSALSAKRQNRAQTGVVVRATAASASAPTRSSSETSAATRRSDRSISFARAPIWDAAFSAADACSWASDAVRFRDSASFRAIAFDSSALKTLASSSAW